MILTAVYLSPWFSWFRNALSDLGVDGIQAVIFNSSLMLGGVLALIFALGLRRSMNGNMLADAGAVLLVLSALFLFSIGLFPETFGRVHFYVSVAFFISAPLSLLIMGVSMIWRRRVKLGAFTVISGLTAASIWAIPWSAAAIPEILAAVIISLWSITLGLDLLRTAKRAKRSG